MRAAYRRDLLRNTPWAMSQANVEAVRRWVSFYNTRDFDGLIELTDPEIEFKSIFVSIESVFRGFADFPHAYFETLDDAYERFRLLPSEFIDAGTAVLMSANVDWRGRGSGAHGETAICSAFWLRVGRVLRIETFTDRRSSLRAVGLER
jgi:ketosteroid isomerase-like protein